MTDMHTETQELIADMVSIRKNTTGLDNTIFISVKFPRHAPRIKVAIDPPTHINPFGSNASVAISNGRVVAGDLSPRVRDDVRAFIEINRQALLDYWEMRIATAELIQQLKPIAR